MSEATLTRPINMLARLFPKDIPTHWHYAIWYGFLFLWMQGEALLNILWALLLLVSLPYISIAIERIKPYKWLWISIAAYLGLRLISITYAIDAKYALYGITDDLRIFTTGLVALVYLGSKQAIQRSLIASLAGFGVLAWHVLWIHWSTYHSLERTANVEFGSLAHLNYAAAFTSVVLFCLFVASQHISRRWLYGIAAIAIPLCILQAPLSSRTTLILFTITAVIYLLLKRSSLVAGAIVFTTLAAIGLTLGQTTTGVSQFQGIEKPMERPSIYIRVDVWKTLYHIWQQHPFGTGPRSFNAIDLNMYRSWVVENAPRTAAVLYGEAALKNKLTGIDLKQRSFITDPHSHYVALLVENGPLGLLAFVSYLLAAFTLSIRYLKSPNNWISGVSEAVTGSLFLLGGCAVMTALFYQSGGIITVIMIAFLISSIAIYDAEKEDKIEG